jgi:hypothetical protein
LPEDVQEKVKAFAVFEGGVNLLILDDILGISTEDAAQFALALVNVGLGELVHHAYLRIDPALPAYQRLKLDNDAVEALRNKWGEAMEELVRYLYEQQSQKTQLAAELTRLDLMNLLALIRWASDHKPPSEVITLTNRLETLFSVLGVQRVLDEVVSIRTAATANLDGSVWSRATLEVRAHRLTDC